MLHFRQLCARFMVKKKVALGHVLSLVSIITPSLHTLISFTELLFFNPHPMVLQPLVEQGLLIIEASRSHSHTLGRTPLDERSARRRDHYLATHNTHKRQTSMPPGGIRTPILASEWPQPTP
jgi:hypothetical protein